MDPSVEDRLLEPNNARISGNPFEISNKKIKTVADGDQESLQNLQPKHKMPDVIPFPKKIYSGATNSEATNSATDKHAISHKITGSLLFPKPDRSLLLPNPDCFFLERKGEPLLSIPLNEEGDKIVSELLFKHTEDYLSLEVVDYKKKYGWLKIWSELRYKHTEGYPRLSDAKSLDEILQWELSPPELKMTSKSLIGANYPISTDELHKPVLSPLDFGSQPATSSVANENPQEKNQLSLKSPRIGFYNSLSEDVSVIPTSKSFKQSGIQSSEAVLTRENGVQSRCSVNVDNEVFQDHAATGNTSVLVNSVEGINGAKLRTKKAVSWKNNLDRFYTNRPSDNHYHLEHGKCRSSDQRGCSRYVGVHNPCPAYQVDCRSPTREFTKRRRRDQGDCCRHGDVYDVWNPYHTDHRSPACESHKRRSSCYRYDCANRPCFSQCSSPRFCGNFESPTRDPLHWRVTSDSSSDDSSYDESFYDHIENVDNWFHNRDLYS